MAPNEITCYAFSSEQLREMFREVVREELSALKEQLSAAEDDKHLTKSELALKLGVSEGTVDNWCKLGTLTPLRLGNARRVYFKLSEINERLQSLKKYKRNVA